MTKKIIGLILFVTILSLPLMATDVEAEADMNIQGLVELQLADMGAPWIGASIDMPANIKLPGRKIQPDYINTEIVFKPGGYGDYSAFQLRGSFKYNLANDIYTQYGVGWVKIGSPSFLTAMVKTGISYPVGSVNINAGAIVQRSLWGAFEYGYGKGLIGLNLGVEF